MAALSLPAPRPGWVARPGEDGRPRLVVVTDRGRRRRKVSVSVRRRRVVAALVGLALVGLALPTGVTGGRARGPGPVLTGGGNVYTVQPGDSLWSIAVRMDPSGDPRPLVAKLRAETGSSTVSPGERIVLP